MGEKLGNIADNPESISRSPIRMGSYGVYMRKRSPKDLGYLKITHSPQNLMPNSAAGATTWSNMWSQQNILPKLHDTGKHSAPCHTQQVNVHD